ncbi:restriction endonuclease subunit S [Streptomyces decoyicus]|uniref:restriction endonuclease subunit S n=1 Tax=Streptomyces decoyicus TaxID=249567 RepID=UPI002E194F20|nr:restriction endonuclease subunit S [Streptomyces decoyicus]
MIEKSGGSADQPVGSVALFDLDVPTVCSNFNARIKVSTSVDSRFACYLMNGLYWSGFTRQFIKQTTGIQNLDAEALLAEHCAIPPMGEQRRIADFLDAETALVDDLYGHRERQIRLLEEAAVSRVYDAVRGSAEPGERKDSGIDWLGDVPVDWRIGAVSHYFEVELGKMLNQDRVSGSHVRPYLRVANVQWDHIDVSELATMNFPPGEKERYSLRPGDLLVNEGGSWPGRAAIWHGEVQEMYYQKALHRIRPQGQESTRWLYYCLVAAERLRVFQVQGNTSTMTHLTREQLRPQRFPFPSPDRQRNIVKELDKSTQQHAKVLQVIETQLSLLAERRQALITAAVTGQFDVTTAGRSTTSRGIA